MKDCVTSAWVTFQGHPRVISCWDIKDRALVLESKPSCAIYKNRR